MRKRILAALLVTTLCFAGCQSSTQTDAPATTPTITEAPESTDATTPTETACPTEAVMPTEAPSSEERGDGPIKPEITEAPEVTEAPVITEEPEITEEPVVEPTEEPVEPTPEPTATLAPTSTPVPTATPKPTATPIPTKAPSIGSDSGSTIELPSLGISIPKRESFNNEGLVDSKDSTWLGREDKSVQELGDTLDKVTNALLEKSGLSTADQSFLLQDNVITFDWYQYSGSGDFMLFRNTSEGYYELSINVPLDYYKNYLGWDVTQANHEVLKTLCSIFSSRPNEIFESIYNTIYIDYEIPKNAWGKVGDCMGYADLNASYGNHLVFRFKPID